MKANNYIQPIVEVTSVQAVYTVLSESNPFNYGGAGVNPNDPTQQIDPV